MDSIGSVAKVVLEAASFVVLWLALVISRHCADDPDTEPVTAESQQVTS